MLKIPSRKSNCGAAAARVRGRRAAMAATEVDMSLDYGVEDIKR